MPDDRTHRWRNSQSTGGTFFVTTSTLDRQHRLLTHSTKDTVTRSLLQTSLALDARLTHYVLLSNHLHLLVHLPDDINVADYVRQLKVDAHDRLGEPGVLWQIGYRGLRITNEQARHVKIGYIHANPVKSGLAKRPEDYRWSSAHAFDKECLDDHLCLDLRKAMNLYAR